MEVLSLSKDRHGALGRGVPIAARLLDALLAALASPATPARSAEPPVRLTDAAELGAFNVGAARAVAGRTPDPAAGGEVVKLDYALPPGTNAGAWAKAFPGRLSAGAIDVVRL